MKNIKYGLKLWTKNTVLIPSAQKCLKEGLYHYVELFIAPGTTKAEIYMWKESGMPFIVHAPHSASGLNPAKFEMRRVNKELATEALHYASILNAKYIIFHPGVDGPIDESIKQLKDFSDSRILIENKPRIGLDGTECVGWSTEQIGELIASTGYGFCLDFGHAHCAAVASKSIPLDLIKGLMAFNPIMYHMTDGLIAS